MKTIDKTTNHPHGVVGKLAGPADKGFVHLYPVKLETPMVDRLCAPCVFHGALAPFCSFFSPVRVLLDPSIQPIQLRLPQIHCHGKDKAQTLAGDA